MAERQGQIRVDSAEVQGAGSFVVVRRVSYGQRQKAAQMIAAANGGKVPTNATSPAELMGDAISGEYLAANDEFTRELLCANVLEWNWVDFDRHALPLPKDEPGMVSGLTDEEVAFLARAISAGKTGADVKN